MLLRPRFSLVLASLLGICSAAWAENYQAVIYGVPSGLEEFGVWGAGDNGMMTGHAYTNSFGGGVHAAFMTSSGWKDIHPAEYMGSSISDSWGGTYHCGTGSVDFMTSHALFWVGGGAAVNLHPSNPAFTSSRARGGFGQVQVGSVEGGHFCAECNAWVTIHGARWSRTAASFSKLHGLGGVDWIEAMCTDGSNYGGFGGVSTGSFHAYLWKQGANVPVDLHPQGYQRSQIFGVWGTQQVGEVDLSSTTYNPFAALWHGTSANFVNLNPTPFKESTATAVRAGLQVGHGVTLAGRNQAIAWHGSAATWINLHARLPVAFQYWNSYATDIDNKGNIVGFIHTNSSSRRRPVIWKRI